jgi:uncharacterized protein YprB with RNaseH-like and TPR domain
VELLDSGVKETILFSLEEKNEISLKNIEKITLGLGSEDAIEGLKSAGIYSRWRDGINHLYTLLLTRILIYPPTLVFP